MRGARRRVHSRRRQQLRDLPVAGPVELVWIKRHWGIENRVHHVRDVTHGEDASRIRTGTGPQLMAALRNTDLNLARLRGETNIAASQRRNAWAGPTAADTVDAA